MRSTPILFLIATLIWGTTWLAITFQLGPVAVEASVTYRFLLAALLLFAWQGLRGHSVWLPWSQQRWLLAMGAAYAVNYALIYRAEMTVSSGLVAVAAASLLFFNILLSRACFGTPLSGRLFAGASLGTLGIALVFWPELQSFRGGDAALGIVFALIATFGAAVANMLAVKTGREKIPVLTVNAWWMIWTAAFTGLWTLLSGQSFGFEFSLGYLLSLLYLALAGSVVAFACYLTLIARVGASQASYIAVLTPVVAIFVSTVFESFQWHVLTGVGMGLIAAGQMLILKKRA